MPRSTYRRNSAPNKLTQLWDYLRGVAQPVDPVGEPLEIHNDFADDQAAPPQNIGEWTEGISQAIPGANPQVIENPFFEGPEPENYELPTGPQYFGRGYGYESQQEVAQRLLDTQANEEQTKQKFQRLGEIAADQDDPRASRAAELLGIGSVNPRSAGAADFSGMVLGMRTMFDPEPLTPEGMSAKAQALISSADPAIGQTFSQAYADRQRPKVYQAASDFIRISELLGDPSVTPEDSQQMMAQWEQTYGPTMKSKPQAISPEQAAQLRDELQLKQISDEAGGVPIVRDHRGQPIVNPGWEAQHKLQTEQQKILADQYAAQLSLAESKFRARMAALRGIKPQAGSGTFESDNAAYQQALVNATQEYLDATSAPPPATRQAPAQPPAPAPQVAPEIANRSGLPLVDDRDDYEALPSGAEFIDKADGKKYRKP